MGINTAAKLPLIAIWSVAALVAAPKLRLTESTVGPVSIAQGQTGVSTSIEAYNAGDGSLSLSVSSSASWLSATVGAARSCSTRAGQCLPIQLAFNTSALSAGRTSASVTVRDPNALDAPQIVTVIVNIGSAVPDRIELFAPPNGRDDRVFTTNSVISGIPTTTSGGNWLSFALDSVSSFQYTLAYKVSGVFQSAMTETTYNGQLAVAGSRFAADNKTVPISLRITSQPIISLSPDRIRVRLPQGGPGAVNYITASNRGLGTLTLSGPTVQSSSTFLTASLLGGTSFYQLNLDPGSLAPGIYSATVTIPSNAVNGTQTVQVEMEVVARTTPLVSYQGVVNNATFSGVEAIAQGTIAAVFGEQFTYSSPSQAASLPLGTTLGNARVLVNDVPAPVYYVSQNQINFQMPYDATVGEATVRVERVGERSNPVTVQVAARAPKMLRLGLGEYALAVNASQGQNFPIPATAGIASAPARWGDVLVFYAIGLGQTTPVVRSGEGAPTSPLAQITPTPIVYFDASSIEKGVAVTPSFVGLTPGFVGLYQINVAIPNGTTIKNNVSVFIETNGVPSNRVEIAVQR